MALSVGFTGLSVSEHDRVRSLGALGYFLTVECNPAMGVQADGVGFGREDTEVQHG